MKLISSTVSPNRDAVSPDGLAGGVAASAAVKGGLAVALITLALMMATESRLPIVWDEGFTLLRLERVRAWLSAVRDPVRFADVWRGTRVATTMEDRARRPLASEVDTRAELFSRQVIKWFWPFAREEPHGHPPFYIWLAVIGDRLAPGWDELARARLGAILLFGATAGALFAFLARRRGLWAAALGAGAFGLSPQLFAMGHYAHYDGPLTCLWLDSVLVFAQAVIPVNAAPGRRSPRWGWVVLFGLLIGAAAGTKLTGWLLPLPFLLWTAFYRDRKGALCLVVGGLIAAITLYATTPPWWNAPIEGLAEFFRSNLTRGETTVISVQFLGTIYQTPNESLPWYNTLVWTVAATPVGFLAWSLAGLARATWHRDDRLEILAVLHWLFPLVLRALPYTPGHDGVRQLLPAFGCLPLVAGMGIGARPGRWLKTLVVAALAEGAISIVVMLPVPLSYFSPAVGGLPGAARLGFEPTYYWDTLTPEVLGWINGHTAPDRSILFSGTPFSYYYLKRSGRLRPEARPFEWSHPWQWYLVQNRPGWWNDVDRKLIFQYGRRRVLLAKFGVPLVWAFERGEVEAMASKAGSAVFELKQDSR